MKLRSKKAIQDQYSKVMSMVQTARSGNEAQRAELYGAQQALAWCLDDAAQSPSLAFKPPLKCTGAHTPREKCPVHRKTTQEDNDAERK